MLPHNIADHPQTKPRSAFRLRSTVALVASVVLLATVGVLHSSELHQHLTGHATKHRLLRELQSLQSLRLHFLIKRTPAHVHGLSEFDVLANPVTSGDSVTFEGIATFDEDGTKFEYSLVNGTAYYLAQSATNASDRNASCLPVSDVPPIDDILTALNGAITVTDTTGIDATVTSECSNGTLYQLTFADDDFLLCSTLPSSSSGFKIFGSDLDIEVHYTSTAIAVAAPTLSEDAAASCEQAAIGTTAISSTTSGLLSGAASDWARRALKSQASQVAMSSSSCECSSTKRSCVFFHGLGSTNELGLQDTSPTSYFGDIIADHAPCCSSIQFGVLNTRDYGWNNESRQETACDLALQVSPTSDTSTKTIKDTIIIAHSMGNLLIGGGIANGKCSLDSSSSWVALSAPLKGSMGSDYLQSACAGSLTGVVASVLELLGQCPAKAGIAALAYQGGDYSSSTLNAQYAAVQSVYAKHVTAALCSNSYTGLLSLYQPVFLLAGLAIPHKSDENDGLVEFQSCAAGLDQTKFGSKYDSTYYVTGLNHIDTTFRYGDALFNNAKKPVKWFECLVL